MSVLIDDFTVAEFKRDLKKLCKRYRHLEQDLETAKKVLRCLPENKNLVVRISDLGREVRVPIYKLRKFRSRDFKGRGVQSGFRIIYAYEHAEKKVTLIEIYHKNKKNNENRNRILKYFRSKDVTI
jgi:mRNA-degrading endonuclease RelE of RelBE toxin-antitoxin system